MTKATETAVAQAMEGIDKAVEKLRGTDYYEFLEEVSGRLSSYMDCYREENPGDFE